MPKTTCQLIREMIADEEKAKGEYLELLEKIKADPCCQALVAMIRKQENTHFKALKKIEPHICKRK